MSEQSKPQFKVSSHLDVRVGNVPEIPATFARIGESTKLDNVSAILGDIATESVAIDGSAANTSEKGHVPELERLLRGVAVIGSGFVSGMLDGAKGSATFLNGDANFASGHFSLHRHKRLIDTVALQSTSVSYLEEYAKENIAEIVTFWSPNKRIGQLVPNAPEAEEPLIILSYETTGVSHSKASDKYARDHTDAAGRSGNYLRYHLLMPAGKADELREILVSNPSAVHDMTDKIMRDEIGYQEKDWAKVRPPYKKWREVDNGQSHIAFRSQLQEAPSRSSIVEF